MSIESTISEIHKLHSQGQDKYTYFLLAAAGAAIGFAVQKTDGLPLSWWLLPVGIATLCWAASFYCGCRTLDRVSASMSANYNLLQLKQGSHPNQPPHPQITEVALREVLSAFERNIQSALKFAIWQFRLLIAGSILFVSWRILEMIRITL
ncbi:hypothetical protein [Comamonas fluminis]|uniref:hypothetical protein n=1 Tax=Comamonas fluminis TaxID=2796366 RepID=UPI001C490687|nr:hypothetical protein [Comamonas fluminis]